MYYIYCILLIATGVGLAYFGTKKFNLSMALSFVIPALAFMGMVDWLGTMSLIIIVIMSVLIFIFTKPLTYFNAWFYTTIVLCVVPFSIYDLIGIESGSSVGKVTVYVLMAVSLVGVIVFRKYLKSVIIGISSGVAAGIGVAGIISAELFQSGKFLDALLLPGALILLFVIGSLFYQFQYVLKDSNEKEKQIAND